jgi:asparagine synthase (glutamine-hydrolysing)
MYFDIKTWLVDDILVKADRCSMAHSLEVRTPFLNHTLAEFIIRLPAHKKLRYMTTKYLFKKSQEKRLPHDIIYGKKEGFSIPVGHWISEDTKDRIMASPLIKDLLGQKQVEHLINHHSRHHYGYHLFTLLCLSLWEKKWGLSTTTG